MDETILKDVFISMNELERYFEGSVPVNLWRGLNIKRLDKSKALATRHFYL